MVDMEEQMPELVDDTENNDSSTSGGQQSQPLITFGQACLNNMGAPTDNLGQSINVTFAVDKENSKKDVTQEQSQGDKLVVLSDKL